MLPQMAFNSCLAFVAVLLLYFSSSVNPQFADNYPTASTPTSWTNYPSLPNTFDFDGGENVRYLLLRRNDYGLSFAVGFYCFPKPCKSFFLSIYIVYVYNEGYTPGNCRCDVFTLKKDIPPQVIWSANRAHPVSENATLELTSKDGLTLRDSDGSLVWSTSGLNRSVAGINITEAGNLVLFDINNSTIWQSFDHPTDCLVMGQTLAEGMNITANSSSTNLAESQYYLTLRAYGLYGYFNSDPTLEYYQHIANATLEYYQNGTLLEGKFIKFMNGSLTMFSTVSNTDNGTIIFTFPPTKSIQYMRLESDGHLRLYDFYEYDFDFNEFQWERVRDLLNKDNCDYPTVCGHYGICNNGQCTCPVGTSGNYFKPVDNRQTELGCYAITNITCHNVNNHVLLELNSVSYFNDVHNVAFNITDVESCKKVCLRDCNCKAAMFQSFDGGLLDGNCLTLPEVFSLKNYQPDATNFTPLAFIKVQGSSSKVGLGAILGSTLGALLFVLTLICIYFVCLRRSKQEQDEDIIKQMSGMPTRFTFEELREATENFVKILGKGGFGTVFEGRWGDEEFMRQSS